MIIYRFQIIITTGGCYYRVNRLNRQRHCADRSACTARAIGEEKTLYAFELLLQYQSPERRMDDQYVHIQDIDRIVFFLSLVCVSATEVEIYGSVQEKKLILRKWPLKICIVI